MNRRGFFTKVLGAVAAVIVYPLDKMFEAALKPSKEFEARLGEWHNYYSECSPDIRRALDEFEKSDYRSMVENLKAKNTVFDALASRRTIPVHAGAQREFFQYAVKS